MGETVGWLAIRAVGSETASSAVTAVTAVAAVTHRAAARAASTTRTSDRTIAALFAAEKAY
jgi:hypothetical protein